MVALALLASVSDPRDRVIYCVSAVAKGILLWPFDVISHGVLCCLVWSGCDKQNIYNRSRKTQHWVINARD